MTEISAGLTATENEIAMVDESNHLPLEYQRELDAWICAWYDAAVARGYIRSLYHPDATTVERLQCFFHAGLTPAEATEACFARKH